MKILTEAKRQVFSLNAPTQPVNPIVNVMTPHTINTNAGSKVIFVSLLRLLKMSFSVHAQIPTIKIHKPNNWNSNIKSI